MTVYGKVDTFRQIIVFEKGTIMECEGGNESLLDRWRIIDINGNWELIYRHKKTQLYYGHAILYYVDGRVVKREMYEGEIYGYWEEFNAHGDWQIGQYFDGKRIGEWKIVKKGGTKKTV